ncbi:MAG: ribonuclease HI family protein [Nitrospirae bacterium]|nr:ribonuclease HI family protein [Nitrospirota bacterium]
MRRAVLYSDGASSGNPGESGIGVVLTFGKRVFEISEYIGIATNNVAEYRALLRGLERARLLRADAVDAFLDSELLVRQINGTYRVKDEKLKELWESAKTIACSFKYFSISHIPRELNQQADRLAKKAIKGARHE